MIARPNTGALILREIAPYLNQSLRFLSATDRRIVENLATVFIMIRRTVKNCGTTNEAVSTLQKLTAIFHAPEDLEAQYSIIEDFPDFELAVRSWKELTLFLDTPIPREYFLEHLMGLETEIRRIRPQTESDLLLDLYRQAGTIALATGHALKLDERFLPPLADLATSVALADSFSDSILSPSDRDLFDRKRLAAIFLASGRKGLQSLPLRFRLFIFLPIRHNLSRAKQSPIGKLDQIFDELFTQTFATAISKTGALFHAPTRAPLKAVPPITSWSDDTYRPPTFFDAKFIVRNQLTRIGIFPIQRQSGAGNRVPTVGTHPAGSAEDSGILTDRT